MFAPSIRWQPTPDTDVVLTGLYQEDDTGSTSQFLPIVGTFRPNPVAGEQLARYTFVGKAGWDRYAGSGTRPRPPPAGATPSQRSRWPTSPRCPSTKADDNPSEHTTPM